jgi:hypothetical protein
MKNITYLIIVLLLIIGCNSTNKAVVDTNSSKVSDTIKIKNEDLDYEVIIIDAGFNPWLITNAKERGYYTETYLENRNQVMVSEWNRRVIEPTRFDPILYDMEINYDRNIHYGYEVNYLIYNYLIYFQLKHKQQLSGFVPRP